MSSSGEGNSGEVVEKSGSGDVGEEGLPYDPNQSFSEHSSASENVSSGNALLVCIEKGSFSSLVLLQSRFWICFYY